MCNAHKTKNAVRTITPNTIETEILVKPGFGLKSAANDPFGSFSILSSFTGAVLPPNDTPCPEELNQVIL